MIENKVNKDSIIDVYESFSNRIKVSDVGKNIADLLTKCLVNTDFNRLVQLSQCHNPRKLELVRLAKSKVSL